MYISIVVILHKTKYMIEGRSSIGVVGLEASI